MNTRKYIEIDAFKELDLYCIDKIYVAEKYKDVDFFGKLEKGTSLEIEGTFSAMYTQVTEYNDELEEEEIEMDGYELLYDTCIDTYVKTLVDAIKDIESRLEFNNMYIEKNSVIVGKSDFRLKNIVIDEIKMSK